MTIYFLRHNIYIYNLECIFKKYNRYSYIYNIIYNMYIYISFNIQSSMYNIYIYIKNIYM